MKHLKYGIAVALLASLALAGASAAQNGDPAAIEAENGGGPTRSSNLEVTFSPAYRFEFGGGINGGGDHEVHRIDAALDLRFKINREIDFTIRSNYKLSDFNFRDVTRLGGKPWSVIHELNIGGMLTYRPTNDWSIFGGPVFQIAAETEADYDEAWIAGGVVGTTVDLGDAVFGVGLGIVSQIENASRIFPIIIIDWEFVSGLRLSSRPVTAASGGVGIELIYELEKNWELAFGAGYHFSRFRLDDNGVAPHGVGEENAVPTWIRLGYQLNQDVSVSIFAGVLWDGQLRLNDTGGQYIAKTDYDPTGFIGVGGTIRF